MTASKNQMRLISVMYACGGMYGRYAAQHKSGFITAHGFVPIRDGDEWTSGGRFRIICHCDNTTGWHNTIVSRDLYERVVNSLYRLTSAKESP